MSLVGNAMLVYNWCDKGAAVCLNVVFISVVQGLNCALLQVQRSYLKQFSHGGKVTARRGALLLFSSNSRYLLLSVV